MLLPEHPYQYFMSLVMCVCVFTPYTCTVVYINGPLLLYVQQQFKHVIHKI